MMPLGLSVAAGGVGDVSLAAGLIGAVVGEVLDAWFVWPVGSVGLLGSLGSLGVASDLTADFLVFFVLTSVWG